MPKNGVLTIGQVARSLGLPATTLRYYERERVLDPTGRSRSRYRLYDPEAVERLRFIRTAQAVGFTLDDIRVLSRLDGADDSCPSEVQRLLQQRLGEVDRKMKDLRKVRKALGRALDRCRSSTGECAVLKDLRSNKGIKK